MAKDTGKKLADMMYGGNPEQAAFGVFPQMKGRRSKQDPEAAKNVPIDLARGFVSGALGMPGDIESFARLPYELITGNESPTILPTSEDILKRIPYGSDTPASRAASGLGVLGGGFYTGPGSAAKAVMAVPKAVKRAAGDFAMAAGASGPKIFVGPKSKTWHQGRAEMAEAMEEAGRSPQEIWLATGTFRGRDGILRQEIDDRMAKFLMPDERKEIVESLKGQMGELKEQVRPSKQKDLFPKALTEAKKEVKGKIGELKEEIKAREKNPRTQGLEAKYIFEHPELYKAYPELADLNVVVDGRGSSPGTHGALSIIEKSGERPGAMEMDIYNRGLLGNPTSTTLHEMQHAVQTLEGMGPGGNPAMAFNDPIAHQILKRRLDEIRSPGTFEEFQRANRFPEDKAREAYEEYVRTYKPFINPKIEREVQKEAAMEYYRRLAGEAEARAVQDRQLMTPQQRMETPPPASYDVPQEDLIVKPPREFAHGGRVHISDNPDTMELELSKSKEPKMANGGSLSDYVNPLRLGQTDTRRPYAKSRFFNPVDPFAAGKNIKDLYGDLYQSEIGSELMDMRPYGGRYADELSSEAGRLGFARDVNYAARNTGDTGFYRPADFERLPGMTNLSDPTLQKNWSTLFDIGNSYWVPDYAEVDPYQYNYHLPTVEGRTREQQDADFNRMYAARNMMMNNAFAQGKMLEGVADPEQVMRELLNAKENTGAYTSDIDRDAAYADQLRRSAGALSALDVGRGTLSYEQGSAINKAAEFQKYLDDMTRAVQQREQSIRNIEKDLAGLVSDPANMDTYNQRKAAYEGQLGAERANLEFARKAQAGYQSALDPYLATIQAIQDPMKLSSADVIGNIRLPNQAKAADGSELQMAGGGLVKGLAKAAKAAKEAPAVVIPSTISELQAEVAKRAGQYGAKRVQRAADEIKNLERMYKLQALREAFTGDNAKAVVTMNPADFEKYAQALESRTEIGPKMQELAKQGQIDKYTVPTDEYIEHLMRLYGFDQVPYLNLFKDETGLPMLPNIVGHEGRHRSRALAGQGETSGLVQISPRGGLREDLPRRSQEEYIEALREELGLTGNKVIPEPSGPGIGANRERPPIILPEPYAEGGEVHMAGGGSLAKLAKLARAPAKSKEEISKIAERLAPQVTGEYVRSKPGSAVTVAGKTKKRFEREKALPVDINAIKEERIPEPVDIEKLKGEVMIGIPGDPTVTGKSLSGVGDVRLESPAPQHGGPLYGLYHDDDHFWASGLAAARRVQNLAREAGEQYDAPVVGKYIMMGPDSINYAQHFADANLQAIDLSKMTKKQIDGFNRIIRQGSPASGPRPSFPGIEDKESAYLHMAMDPELRKHFNALMQQNTVTEAFNLPSGNDIRFAITEPALRDLETGVTGFSMGRMRPDIPSSELKLSEHPTYTHDIPGSFLGQTKYPVPYELSFPDTLKTIRENPKQAGHEFGSLKMVGPRQTIDQQLIDELRMYEERMKQLTGKKKGGAVKKAAGGEITADDLILEERKL